MLRRARCVQRALHQYLANRFGTSCGTPAVPLIPPSPPLPLTPPQPGRRPFSSSAHRTGTAPSPVKPRVAPTWPVAQNPDVVWHTAGMEARRGPDADRFWGKGNSRDLACRRDPRRLPALRVVKWGSEASRRVGGALPDPAHAHAARMCHSPVPPTSSLAVDVPRVSTAPPSAR